MIGSALVEKVGQGEVSGCTPLDDSAWQLLQLAVKKLWSVPASLVSQPYFFCFWWGGARGREKYVWTLASFLCHEGI